MEAEAGKEGRGLVIGWIYTCDGGLIPVCTQEGVVRGEPETTSKVVPKIFSSHFLFSPYIIADTNREIFLSCLDCNPTPLWD
ncbi:hypothetical protein KEM48_013985 [Puccinia striiformis f. sp. tritici PST-130]|nr:hypothetical protein H4Q26_015311 [Puccinia striiformis f. sp. tritici PST-130]KAI9630489.1 hypothetical protein KEM48_013985 [Puccinia striiformis f. sp. tritici PST-130]